MRRIQQRVVLLALGVLACSAEANVPGPPITFSELLGELRPSHRWLEPGPSYRSLQASSQEPGGSNRESERWWANLDRGHFAGFVNREGRREAIMLDVRGPGVIQRIWSANPLGTLRVYLDGASEPVIEAPMEALLSGAIAPFESPFAYIAARGYNLYFPIPFAEGALVTTDLGFEGEGEDLLYYHVGYRSYEAHTLPTYSAELAANHRAEIERAAASLLPNEPERWDSVQDASSPLVLRREGGVIETLQVEVPSDGNEDVLRHALLVMRFDGEETVRVPLSDAFGSGAGLNPHRSALSSVDGARMTLWFPMPFDREAEIEIEGVDAFTEPPIFRVAHAPYPFGENTRYFRATFRSFPDIVASRRDLPLLELTNEGVFVGASLVVANPVDVWWGEGDERIYVDQDPVDAPSFPGTGTEDYFGYAFIDPTLFDRPFHNQLRSGAPRSDGVIVQHRYHVLDDIPFRERFRFDLELWHWTPDVRVTFESTLFWYSRAPFESAPLSAGDVSVP